MKQFRFYTSSNTSMVNLPLPRLSLSRFVERFKIALKGGNCITRNQIEYQKHLETQRANRMAEELARARDLVTQSYYAGQLTNAERNLSEVERHNLEWERENALHNRNVELEAATHNREVERQSLEQLGINRYSAESGRLQALASQQQAAASLRNAAASESQALTSMYRQQEEARSNLAREEETKRTNLAREAETKRANEASESLRKRQLVQENWQVQSGLKLNSAKQENIEADTHYKPQENARNWIGTVSNALSSLVRSGAQLISLE